MSEGRPAPEPDLLLPLLRRMLRPVVRLLIRGGVTFPVAADLLRTLYVDVATHSLSGPAPTDSRIALLTGVHRKELRRLRTLPPGEPEPPAVTLNGQLIATWLGAARYTDPAGEPLVLPRFGPAPSFESLVTDATRDIRPRAVLDGWLAEGVVTLDGDLVTLNAAAFLPQPGRAEQLFYFGRNLHDHAAAAAANVLADTAAPFVDRSVHYDRMTPESVAQLEAAGRRIAQRALLEFNRLALAQLDHGEPPPGTPTRRINLGLYLYSEDEPG